MAERWKNEKDARNALRAMYGEHLDPRTDGGLDFNLDDHIHQARMMEATAPPITIEEHAQALGVPLSYAQALRDFTVQFPSKDPRYRKQKMPLPKRKDMGQPVRAEVDGKISFDVNVGMEDRHFHPIILIRDKAGHDLAFYYVPAEAWVTVEKNQKVATGDVLAYLPKKPKGAKR